MRPDVVDGTVKVSPDCFQRKPTETHQDNRDDFVGLNEK